jgi:hypothetical protein
MEGLTWNRAKGLGAWGASWLVAVACTSSSTSGTSNCSSPPACRNDPPPSASEIGQCEALASSATCGAVFQQYLDCASTQLKCTSAGLTDDAATTAAIGANCASPAAAYKRCAAGAACGQFDEACCTGGAQPCATGCCDPQTNRCLDAGMTCSMANTVCQGTTCASCGAPGEPCCGTTCPVSGCCDNPQQTLGAGTCVADGAACRSLPDAGGSLFCAQGSCSSCGTVSISCCPGNVCTAASALCSGGFCEHCGARYEPCCASNACSDPGGQCVNGTCT